ncbi:DEKNAAC103125 [Brettanomyces naardenensis]|uniref:Coatomer subunit zeta n=1 Tax=Brettanomyces naardenensis TaxID=13370 RepID=A0A448YMF0_BRENA|nr:DEKNAAC103125 [Brettanomyces naardenensis]
MTINTSLYSVEAVAILDNEGRRLFAKYYKAPHEDAVEDIVLNEKKQLQFEKDLFAKTFKQGNDIILFDNHAVVYREFPDCVLYVIGSLNENEVLLYNVLQGLSGALEIVLKNSVDKGSIQESYDLVVLTVDETVDDGIVLETDSTAIASRVTNAPTEDVANIKIDLSERGLLNAFNFARKNISDRLQQGF